MHCRKLVGYCCILAGIWFAGAAARAEAHSLRIGPVRDGSEVVLDAKALGSADTLLIDTRTRFLGTLILRGLRGDEHHPIVIAPLLPDSSAAITGSDRAVILGSGAEGRLTLKPAAGSLPRLYGLAALSPAREPDVGWFWIKRIDSQLRFKASGPLPALAAADFARIFMRYSDGHYMHLRVARTERSLVELAGRSPERYPLRKDRAFKFYGSPSLIDQPGEYALNSRSGDVELLPPAKGSPDSLRIGVRPSGLRIDRCEHLVVDGLSFAQHTEAAIRVDRSRDILLRNLSISEADTGIYIERSSEIAVQQTQMTDMADCGVYTLKSVRLELRDCAVRRCGLQPFPDRSPTAVWVNGDSTLITGMSIDSSAYNGIRWLGRDATIRDNTVRHTNLLLGDGGAIYCYRNRNSHSLVEGNLIEHDGNPLDGKRTTRAGGGIYFDVGTSGVEARDNIVVDYNFGVKLHNCYANVVRNNTLIGYRTAGMRIREDHYADKENRMMVSNVVKGNRFFAPGRNRAVVFQVQGLMGRDRLATIQDNGGGPGVSRWATVSTNRQRAKLLNLREWNSLYATGDRRLTREELDRALERLNRTPDQIR